MKSITVIYQNKFSKKLTNFLTISSIQEIQQDEQDKLFVDCDSDSYLILSESSNYLSFSELNMPEPFKGLKPVITIDQKDNILMQAFINHEALCITLQKQLACYYSRSRSQLWLKGETSGHTQKILNVQYNSSNDLYLYRVEQTVAACHTGNYSCFYTEI